MSKLIYVPLEHIEGRYTKHLDRDITNYLELHNIDYLKIMPIDDSPPLPEGMFLNAPFTTKFKSLQMALIAELYETDQIQSGDRFFFSDIWFPGIESIAYMNYFTKKDVKITGIIHAGSFTDTDFVRDMERWAKNFEDIVFDISDKIFCASNFIRDDIVKKRMVSPHKLMVTGLPLDFSALDTYKGADKENIVVFNGRLCDEKQPWLFDQLEKQINRQAWFDDQPVFVKTQEENLSKDEYYDLLSRAKVVVSYALQENFGFGIAEAAYLGCVPVVPNRLVYPELYGAQHLFDTFEQSVHMTEQALLQYSDPDIIIRNNCLRWWLNG